MEVTRDELIINHQWLVKYIVKKYAYTYDEDLIQEGNMALLRASQSFNPEAGYAFSSYAYKWVCGVTENL